MLYSMLYVPMALQVSVGLCRSRLGGICIEALLYFKEACTSIESRSTVWYHMTTCVSGAQEQMDLAYLLVALPFHVSICPEC